MTTWSGLRRPPFKSAIGLLQRGQSLRQTCRRASPELAVAWCNAMLGLGNGNLDRHSAIGIITAIESFASKRASVGRPASA